MPLIILNERVVEEAYLSSNSVESKTNSLTLPVVEVNENNVVKKSIPERIPAFGLIMAVLSGLCFSVSALIVKLTTEMHSLEVLGFRCTFQLVFYLIAILIYNYPIFGVEGHRIDLGLRALFGSISSSCIFMAYRMIPLADASTIHFSSPVFVIIIAYFLLKEPITVLKVFAVIVTLIGVIFIAKPNFIFNPNSEIVINNRYEGIILSIIAALSTAMMMITLRKLKTTPVAVVIMWFSLLNLISSIAIVLLFDKFIWPTDWWTWTLLTVIGVFGISDQFLMTLALHYESAGVVSVARTLNIVLAFVWDVIIFSEAIDWKSLLGSSLVSICVIILGVSKWREEKPELFNNFKYNIFCCNKRDDNQLLRKDSQPFYDSIDSRFFPTTNQTNNKLIL